MKLKVYGWTGRAPDRSEHEVYEGETALDVVRAMMAVPFAANLTPAAFMIQSLSALARAPVTLPSDAPLAAEAYLSRLASLGLTEPA